MRLDRFNPIGVPTLYLALTLEGMFLEMGHGFGHRIEPLTVCCYTADIDDVVDLRDDRGRAGAAVSLADVGCAWVYDRANGRVPASWTAAERLRTTGASGLLVRSFATGARRDMNNLVLWTWGPALPHRIEGA